MSHTDKTTLCGSFFFSGGDHAPLRQADSLGPGLSAYNYSLYPIIYPPPSFSFLILTMKIAGTCPVKCRLCRRLMWWYEFEAHLIATHEILCAGDMTELMSLIMFNRDTIDRSDPITPQWPQTIPSAPRVK